MIKDISKELGNLLSTTVPSEKITSDLLLLDQIPCKSYQKALIQELISSIFFDDQSNILSIVSFLSNSSILFLQAKNIELLTFLIETLDMLLRRSLNNFSEDQTEHFYICNNYSLQFQSESHQIQELAKFFCTDINLRNTMDFIVDQLKNENIEYMSFTLLHPLLSFNCLYLSHFFSNETIKQDKEKNDSSISSIANKLLNILETIMDNIQKIEEVNPKVVFKEWLSNFLVDFYKLFNIVSEKEVPEDYLKTIFNIYKSLSQSKECRNLLTASGIVKFICEKDKIWEGNVVKSLECKYRAYILAYTISLSLREHIFELKHHNKTKKELPTFFKAVVEACILFERTPQSGKKEYIPLKLRRANFRSLLARLIRTIVKKSNDENGFIIMRTIIDYSEILGINIDKEVKELDQLNLTSAWKIVPTKVNKTTQDFEEIKKYILLETDKTRESQEIEILRILQRGTFPYELFLDCMEWSIDAVLDFLLEDYSFLELVFKVLKRIAAHSKEEVRMLLKEKESFRMIFFTEELMKKLEGHKGQFSFNIIPLINLLKTVKEIIED